MRVSFRVISLAVGVATAFACGDDDEAPDTACRGQDCARQNEGDAASIDGDEAAPDDAGAERDAEAADVVQDVTIRFKAKLGDQELVCGQKYVGQGTTQVTATPQDFRFYVQEVRLIRKGSAEEVRVQFDDRPPFQRAEVALIDFTDAAGKCDGRGGSIVNTVIYGKVPAGEYDGIVFVNGVPEELNHAGPAETAAAPLDDVTLFWNWLGGYRFIVAELLPMASAHDAGQQDAGTPTDAGTHASGQDAGSAHDASSSDGGVVAGDAGGHAMSAAAFVHVGSTGCSGSPSEGFTCMRKARNEIRLPGFNPEKNSVIADLAEVFKKSDLTAPPQCHSVAPACAAPYAALGIDMHTGAPASTQQVFRVE